MAKDEAIQAGALEGVMINEQGYVAECTGDNLFIVNGGRVVTPPVSDGALDGITRQVIFELAAGLGIRCVEKSITRYDIFTADECFLTGSAAEVVPVASLDGRVVGSETPGPVTIQLIEAFRALTLKSGTPLD